MSDGEEQLVDLDRFLDIGMLTKRATQHYAGEGFDVENPPCWNGIRVLVVGAGGLGCELLHCLALSGFSDIECIDMDTIDLSNLNRQFLFRNKDIGQPKADVAAAFINKRFPWVNVVPHFGRIEEKSDDFYRSFHIVIMGLDSITARKWLNDKYASLATYGIDDEGKSVCLAATPLIDGGTEGFRGSARHIKFGKTACIECSMYLYPPMQGVPMCTLENVPRVPEHCVLYVKQKTWDVEKPFGAQSNGEAIDVDGDNQEHILWIMEASKKRQEQFKIEGNIDFQFTQGVVKNVIPAVGFTNAMIAAMCANEALKMATGAGALMDNYTFYDGSSNGIASYTQQMFNDPTCPSCQAREIVKAPKTASGRAVADAMLAALKPVAPMAAEPVAVGNELRLVATIQTENGPETLHLLYPSSDPRASTLAAYTTTPVLDRVKQARAAADVDEAELEAAVECEASGGALKTLVVKFLLRFE